MAVYNCLRVLEMWQTGIEGIDLLSKEGIVSVVNLQPSLL